MAAISVAAAVTDAATMATLPVAATSYAQVRPSYDLGEVEEFEVVEVVMPSSAAVFPVGCT